MEREKGEKFEGKGKVGKYAKRMRKKSAWYWVFVVGIPLCEAGWVFEGFAIKLKQKQDFFFSLLNSPWQMT